MADTQTPVIEPELPVPEEPEGEEEQV